MMPRAIFGLKFSVVFVICIVFLILVSNVDSSSKKRTKHGREKKARLIRKYLKSLKRKEGAVRLVDGREVYEGR